ncbi:MAG: hypothetical protein ACSLFQ_01805 [Thermoanaerobaculia bacterium]
MIYLDPIRNKDEYDLAIERGDDLEWRAPAGADNIIVNFKASPYAAMGPVNNGKATSRTFAGSMHGDGVAQGSVRKFDPKVHHRSGQIEYTIKIEYGSYGFIVIDPFVKILP